MMGDDVERRSTHGTGNFIDAEASARLQFRQQKSFGNLRMNTFLPPIDVEVQAETACIPSNGTGSETMSAMDVVNQVDKLWSQGRQIPKRPSHGYQCWSDSVEAPINPLQDPVKPLSSLEVVMQVDARSRSGNFQDCLERGIHRSMSGRRSADELGLTMRDAVMKTDREQATGIDTPRTMSSNALRLLTTGLGSDSGGRSRNGRRRGSDGGNISSHGRRSNDSHLGRSALFSRIPSFRLTTPTFQLPIETIAEESMGDEEGGDDTESDSDSDEEDGGMAKPRINTTPPLKRLQACNVPGRTLVAELPKLHLFNHHNTAI